MVKTAIQNSPHLRSKNSTFKMMMEFFICVCVLWVSSVIYYFCATLPNYYSYIYGLRAIEKGVIGILFAFIFDFIFYLPIFWKDEKRLKLPKGQTRANEYLHKVLFNYSYVTGLLVALLFPIGTPVYVLIVAVFFSTFIFKNLFGGFGSNIFNPAIVGRVIGQLAFGSQLKTYLGSAPTGDDANNFLNAGASITNSFANGNSIGHGLSEISTLDMFLGNYVGTLGETMVIVLIVIAIYLSIRKIIDWRVVVTYIVTFYLSYFFMNLCAGQRLNSFENALRQLFVGGALFGCVLCLTDPVTSPVSRTGKIVFAAGSAFVTILIRMFASAPEGMAYSILIMNMLTPMIDYFISERTNKKMWKKYTAISILPTATLLMGVIHGAMNYVKPADPNVTTQVIETESTYGDEGMGKFTTKVTLGDDEKVYKIEIVDASNTFHDQTWINGGDHNFGFGDINFDTYSQTYIPTEGHPIDFSVYENATENDPIIKNGATEASFGLVKNVQEAISQYRSQQGSN